MHVRRTACGLAVLLLLAACGGGSDEGLDGVATEPSAEEVVCFNGSYEPAEVGEVVPREDACPEQSPSTSSEPSSSAQPTGGDVSAALLTPERAAQAEAEQWRAGDEAPEPGPLLDPCDERTFPRSGDVEASGEGVLEWRRHENGAVLRQEAFRYASALAAEQAFTEYADRVQRCPRRPEPNDPNGSSAAFEVVDRTQAGGQQLLVRQTACNPACIAHFRMYLGVAQHADLLTVLTYGQLVDSDPQAESAAVLDVAAQVLAEAAGGG